MAGKRSATTELNHDNWNEESEPEEAGMFAKAANDVLEKRVIKTAKRRFPSRDGATKSAFGTFAGFKTTPATSVSPFGFLANTSTTSATITSTATTTTVNTSSRNVASNGSKVPENNSSKIEDPSKAQTLSSTSSSSIKQGNEKTKRHSSDYYAKLKGLNESVAAWIKTHVDANPFCILSPIFKDYENYLKEIRSKEESIKTRASHTPQRTTETTQNDDQKEISVEKKLETPSLATSNANTKSALPAVTEWKPEKSIFSNVAANTKSIFGNTEQSKTENPKSIFSNVDVTPNTGKYVFGVIERESNVASMGIFGKAKTESNPFLHKSTATSDGGKTDKEDTTSDTKSVAPTFPVATFSFGQSSNTNNVTAGFSFGGAKPFSFAPQAVKPQDSEDKTDNEKDEEDEEPPKPDFKPVTEEDAVYEQRCKVYIKKGDNFSDRGVGMLYLKPTPNGKTQLIVRADTALGNLLLNTLLTQSIPIKRMNKNTIMLVCLPMPDSSPPPVPLLLRVKTSEVADELFETLNEYKK